MFHIDALSRVPKKASVSQDTEAELLDERLEVFITMTEKEQVRSMQHTDTRLREIVGINSRDILRYIQNLSEVIH